jgi:hypothetical protein
VTFRNIGMLPLILSKNALREEGCPWLIKRPGHIFIDDVKHFNTPPHLRQLFGQTRVQRRGKGLSSSKEPILIPCEKFTGLLTLSKYALRDDGCPWLIKCPNHLFIGDVGHFNSISLVIS